MLADVFHMIWGISVFGCQICNVGRSVSLDCDRRRVFSFGLFQAAERSDNRKYVCFRGLMSFKNLELSYNRYSRCFQIVHYAEVLEV